MDYQSIIQSQTFRKEKIRSILEHDVVFWLGDLNFRLNTDSNYSAEDIVDFLSKNELNKLLEHDELNQTISRREAFANFSECNIDFMPTYKFIPKSQKYDMK